MPSAAQLTTAAPVSVDQTSLQAVSQTVDRLKTEANADRSDESLAELREQAAAAQAYADTYGSARAKELAALDAKLKLLSTPQGAARPHLSTSQLKDLKDLLAQRAKLAGQIEAARKAGASASDTYNAISNQRRSVFDSKVFERTASPVQAQFWTSLLASLQPDMARLLRLAGGIAQTALDAPEPRAGLCIAVALALAFAVAVPLRLALKHFVRKRAAKHTSDHDFHRTARAVSAVLIDTALPGAAALIVNLGLTWGELVSEKTETLVQALVISVFWGGAVVALSRQLAGASNERLLAVPERLASHMRALPWLVAVITGAGFLLTRLNNVVGASLAATIAANCVVSLAYAGVASLVLLMLSEDHSEDEGADPAAKLDTPTPGRALVSLALSGAIVVTVGAVFAGFTTFAHLVSSQIFWISLLVGLTYLLLRFTDDAVDELFKPHGLIGRMFIAILNLRLSLVQQLGVLTSAFLQILIVLGAISLALTPFGRNGDLVSSHLGQIGQAVHLGSIVISPRSVATGLVSLLIGLGLVHLVERWANRRFLPVTDWDVGVRTSVATGIRYVGVGVTVLWALAAAGLGFKQIALVASALSVGIGFGLQQIVQNFVSGLILLVERPVKVGDWVNVGGVEGDVQRIRVRATEIRTFDRTTLIVPNSDLITKSVQNKTLGDPHGRVKLQLTVGAAADAARATEVIAGVLAADADVLTDPKPNVFIDSLTEGGAVNFICFAYVESPRDAYRVKSRLYGEAITALADAKIGFVGSSTQVIMEPGPGLKAMIDDVRAAQAKPEGPQTS